MPIHSRGAGTLCQGSKAEVESSPFHASPFFTQRPCRRPSDSIIIRSYCLEALDPACIPSATPAFRLLRLLTSPAPHNQPIWPNKGLSHPLSHTLNCHSNPRSIAVARPGDDATHWRAKISRRMLVAPPMLWGVFSLAPAVPCSMAWPSLLKPRASTIVYACLSGMSSHRRRSRADRT